MKTFSYTITDEVGIHARPAGLLAKKAGCDTEIPVGASYRNLPNYVRSGELDEKLIDESVTCKGADEDKASEALKAFFEETL